MQLKILTLNKMKTSSLSDLLQASGLQSGKRTGDCFFPCLSSLNLQTAVMVCDSSKRGGYVEINMGIGKFLFGQFCGGMGYPQSGCLNLSLAWVESFHGFFRVGCREGK